jgi:hypothetical protein
MLRILFVTGLIIAAFAPYDTPTVAQEGKATPISVQGLLLVGEFFGPPNYGERPRSDRIERSYYLQLPAPVGYQQPKYTAPEELREALEQSHHFIQLVVFTPNQSAATRLVGSRVQVSGSLFRAETGHHRTAVLLEARTIQKIEQWHW